MKKNIIATLLLGFGAIAAITVQAQTIKIDTLNNDIVIPGDIERDHLEDDHHDKDDKGLLSQYPEMQKLYNKQLATPSPSASSGGGCCAPVFPTTYPAFKPCFCPVVINSTAMNPSAPNSNIGFEVENVDKGISNWIFFMGMNRPWLAYEKNQAWFECERYYTGNMTTTGTPTGLWANQWTSAQYADFEKRTAIMTMTTPTQPTDVVGGFPVVPPSINNTENKHALRLNRPEDPPGFDNYREKIWGSYNSAVMAVRKVRIYKSDPYLAYKYAVALSNYFGHGDGQDAYFRVQVYKLKNGGDCANGTNLNECCDEMCCEGVFINAKAVNEVPGLQVNPNRSSTWGTGGTIGVAGNSKFKDWTMNTINFLPYIDAGETYHDFILAVSASYCKGNHDYGYAYLDLEPSVGIAYTGLLQPGSNISFEGPANNSYGIGGGQELFQWRVYKVVSGSNVLVYTSSNSASNTKFNYQFIEPGTYKVRVDVESGFTSANCPTAGLGCTKWYERTVEIQSGDAAFLLSCSDCIGSFAPLVNNKYVLSAWVKQDYIPAGGLTTFTEPRIEVSYIYTGTPPVPAVEVFTPSGPIIDGWQKVEREFTIPANATSIQIDLKGYSTNTTGHNVYYDDIRVFPFRADMKSFVYDPMSQKLMAQMDENNYATFYEYDEEGKLKRVKKETERGVMTIKEAGSNSSKR
ncbi:MAG: hypothetical protein EAY81_04140 [Bacteroidetes bacterium]|nr:MAG: hypothetical protein EAY81_04140 [Bacteroidota bacterium]